MTSGNIQKCLRSALTCLFLITASGLMLAQKPKSSSPPPKPSAPAHSSAPAQHPSSGTQHTSNGNQHTGTQTSGHTTTQTGHTGTGNNGHTGTTNNGRTGTTNNGRTGTTNTGHTGTANTGHTGNTMAGHNSSNGPGAKGGAMAHGANGNAGGHAAGNRTPPGKQVSLRGGGTASIRPNGQIRSINRNGMQISHGMHGGRTVVSTRNGARIVTTGRRGGYVQRPYFSRGGRSYYSRTYYYHGGYRVGVYRGYYYGGRPYYGYYPAYYYHPVYYGWAYNPWPAPVAYGWGWGGAPWYGYYGPYYAPYPVYPAAYFWLTDYMIAASLQAAYEAGAASSSLVSPFDPGENLEASLVPMAAETAKAALSPEVKNALAEEVKATLAAEKAEAEKPSSGSSAAGGSAPATSNEAPPALDPNFKTFLVSSDLSLVTDGDECALSQGDVIQRTTDQADDDGNVTVKVVASTKTDCAVGKEGPVSTDDLQEMYNSFRESVKDGMGDLAKKQGSGGLPKAPDTSTTNGDVPAPPPDKTAEKSLQDQQSAADQAESEVKQEAGSGGGGSQ